MEQKRMEEINIERSKELFEHEMTAIVLALKGEFATVSGKALGLSQYELSDEMQEALRKASPPKAIPAVEVKRIGISHELTGKLLTPVELCCDKIGAAKLPCAQAMTTDTLKTLLSGKKSVAISPLPSVTRGELSSHLAVPSVTPVQVQNSVAVKQALSKIRLPAIAVAPQREPQVISVPKGNGMKHPSVPSFHLSTTAVDYTPGAMTLPVVKEFAQMKRETVAPLEAKKAPKAVAQIAGSIPAPKGVSEFKFAPIAPRVSIDVSKVAKVSVSVPHLSQIPVECRTAVEIPALTELKALCAELLMDTSASRSEVNARKVIQPTVQVSVPSKEAIRKELEAILAAVVG